MIENKNIFYNETIIKEVLPNGLTVYLMPKSDYVQYSALFITDFGSFDTKFKPIGEQHQITVPEGIAHFLEHKMFETNNGEDIMKLFYSLGSNVNAFTSYDRTAYTVSGTDNVEEVIELLLDFVQSPSFTEESVEKEKSIIEQEILMYLDDPKNFARTGILKNLFGEDDMIWREIGGTPESIKAINKDILLKTYYTYYHPSNMTLVVVGGFDYLKLIETIKNNQAKKSFHCSSKITRENYKFKQDVDNINTIGYFNIETPIAYWGAKYPYVDDHPLNSIKMAYAIDFLIDANFSSFSSFNEDLRKNGLGEITINYSNNYYNGYGYFVITGTTKKYKELYQFIESKFNEIFTKTIDEDKLKIWRRGIHTNNIKIFNSIHKLCNNIAEYHFKNCELFDCLDIPSTISVEDIHKALQVLKQFSKTTFTVLSNK